MLNPLGQLCLFKAWVTCADFAIQCILKTKVIPLQWPAETHLWVSSKHRQRVPVQEEPVLLGPGRGCCVSQGALNCVQPGLTQTGFHTRGVYCLVCSEAPESGLDSIFPGFPCFCVGRLWGWLHPWVGSEVGIAGPVVAVS